MEIEALESILADDFKGFVFSKTFSFYYLFIIIVEETEFLYLLYIVTEIHTGESGLNTSNRCFQITVTPQVYIITSHPSSLIFSCMWKGLCVVISVDKYFYVQH